MLDTTHYTMPISMYTHMYVCIRNEYNLMLIDFATIPPPHACGYLVPHGGGEAWSLAYRVRYRSRVMGLGRDTCHVIMEEIGL